MLQQQQQQSEPVQQQQAQQAAAGWSAPTLPKQEPQGSVPASAAGATTPAPASAPTGARRAGGGPSGSGLGAVESGEAESRFWKDVKGMLVAFGVPGERGQRRVFAPETVSHSAHGGDCRPHGGSPPFQG